MTPIEIVNALEKRLGVMGAPRQLRDAIEFELLQSGLDAATAAERVDRVRAKVLKEIESRKDKSLISGGVSTIDVRSDQTEIVFGANYVFANDSTQLKIVKKNRGVNNDLMSYLISLNFSQFEKLGRGVLRELGCRRATVTRHAGDQGIDFFGDLTIGSLLNADASTVRLMHESRLIVVGQAKHYPKSAIGPSVIRELVGALSLVRTRTFSKDDIDIFDNIEIKPFSSIIAMIFSTGDFTKGARHLAQQAGLVTYSGAQLSLFLADKGVGVVQDAGAVRFDQHAFDTWLER